MRESIVTAKNSSAIVSMSEEQASVISEMSRQIAMNIPNIKMGKVFADALEMKEEDYYQTILTAHKADRIITYLYVVYPFALNRIHRVSGPHLPMFLPSI